MKKTIVLLLTLILILSVCLCSCDSGELKISPNNKSLFELATKVYTDAELEEIKKFSGTIDELHQKYKIECLRETSGTEQRVSYLGENKVLNLYFTSKSDYVWKELVSISPHSLEEFNNAITVGQIYSEVREFDPSGYFYSVGSDAISVHVTKDGYLFSVLGQDDPHSETLNVKVVEIISSIL